MKYRERIVKMKYVCDDNGKIISEAEVEVLKDSTIDEMAESLNQKNKMEEEHITFIVNNATYLLERYVLGFVDTVMPTKNHSQEGEMIESKFTKIIVMDDKARWAVSRKSKQELRRRILTASNDIKAKVRSILGAFQLRPGILILSTDMKEEIKEFVLKEK